MFQETLAASGKELSPVQLERVVAAEMTKNPLFLKITLNVSVKTMKPWEGTCIFSLILKPFRIIFYLEGK